MQFRPIISAMRRNKVGAILIAVQMAITLAILCNALFIVQQRIALSERPSGVDEANVVVLDNQWVGNPPDQAARQEGDLAALRSLPGVQDAFATNSVPLTDSGSTEGISLHPDQKTASARAALYFGDEHAIASLGLKLIAGRNFNADEVTEKVGYTDLKSPTAIIITASSRPRPTLRDHGISMITEHVWRADHPALVRDPATTMIPESARGSRTHESPVIRSRLVIPVTVSVITRVNCRDQGLSMITEAWRASQAAGLAGGRTRRRPGSGSGQGPDKRPGWGWSS